MPDSLDVAVLGFGTVGRALAEAVHDAEGVRLVAATDSTGTVHEAGGLDVPALLEAKQASGTVTAAPGTRTDWTGAQAAHRAPGDVLAQVTPSRLDAPEASLAALEAAVGDGKHAVTAAKDALAACPARVREAAKASGTSVRAGASVGAGVPVLGTVDALAAADEIRRVEAVLNGSTTFLLSRMAEGASRDQAMAEAREEGLLEDEPEKDLSGRDAAAKAAIVHQRVYGSTLSIDEVDTEGIGAVGARECRAAARRGFAIRLLAEVDPDGARVRAAEVPQDSPLAPDGPSCCVRLVCRRRGTICLSGPGAGPRETAGALLADLVALRRDPAAVRRRERAVAETA